MDIAPLACRRHQVADAEAERAQTAKKQSKHDRRRQLQFRQKNQADPGKACDRRTELQNRGAAGG